MKVQPFRFLWFQGAEDGPKTPGDAWPTNVFSFGFGIYKLTEKQLYEMYVTWKLIIDLS